MSVAVSIKAFVNQVVDPQVVVQAVADFGFLAVGDAVVVVVEAFVDLAVEVVVLAVAALGRSGCPGQGEVGHTS